ncbi:hypothetical protein AKJ57_00015 [candidate division MSBL1 archaeon SCGC-AAA259A05]|uniref:Hydroxymethylbilane synthase n=1 Tax=candidate division MSBL1 archaeon SCGC-AAA259A05 TaxID=1698259 RepID=A0A133UBY3_9EURY|nr:hypothetical protein AKJ57_00015 [candidate division MSBL1 archaeon SCGC-AAA259A05]
MKVRIGTRGSKLARLQARKVAEKLRKSDRGLETKMVVVETSGDRGKRKGTGVFVKEINRAVYKGKVDIGVHSLKDLPTELPKDVVLASFPERLTPNDVLVSSDGESFRELSPGSVIGTGSPRRRSEISRLRTDLKFKDIRGNVDTRIKKVEEGGGYDALVTSMAALERLGFREKVDYEFSFREVVPAAGQGILGVVARKNDEVMDLLSSIDDENVNRASICERAFLRELGLGCKSGAGAIARVEKEFIEIISVLHDERSRKTAKLSGSEPEKLGKEAARRLKS